MKRILKTIGLITLISLSSFHAFAADSGVSSFTSTENIKQAQIAMATNEYIVTAGDIYSLVYNGGAFSITVDSTYRVRIANLGIINAKGLTIQEFKNKVESLIVNNYPSGGIQFFLSNPAQFHVYIRGEVNSAKTLNAWALTHVSEVISSSMTSYSSRRFVTIISADGTEKQYDLFKAERLGDFFQDPYLRPGDTIVLNKMDRQVSLSGSVIRPGTYELKPGEELKELIFEYGEGFAPGANKDKIVLSRYTGSSPSYTVDVLKESDLHVTTPLACYDRVSISSMRELTSVVYVEGAVSKYYSPVSHSLVASEDDENAYDSMYPGFVSGEPTTSARQEIEFQQNMTLHQLVFSHSGMFLNSADLTECYLSRVSVAKDGKINEEKIKINIDRILHPSEDGSVQEDILLKPNDRLMVPFSQYYVTVTGGVTSPGRYPYQPDKPWSYYVNLAMGFDYNQSLFKIVKITDKNGVKLSKKDNIPPEAVIYASRNSPQNGWLFPLLTALISFATSCFTLYGVIVGGGNAALVQ